MEGKVWGCLGRGGEGKSGRWVGRWLLGVETKRRGKKSKLEINVDVKKEKKSGRRKALWRVSRVRDGKA